MASGRIPQKFLNLKQVKTINLSMFVFFILIVINEHFLMVKFMLRQEVLKLYREVLRTAKKVDEKKEIISWARSDIEQHRLQTDEVLSYTLNSKCLF